MNRQPNNLPTGDQVGTGTIVNNARALVALS
jgi:hypothetical protein